MINCPGCHGKMDALALESHHGTAIIIDTCWGCQMIWFDHLESNSLSAMSVIELFKRIHDAQMKAAEAVNGTRNTVGNNMNCPVCSNRLNLTNDIQKNGRFSYHRCPQGHGRATSFTQFLREKNFIRSLNPGEIKSLSVNIKQIRCSSCGGSINLTHDTSCSHCGSAISVLDNDAVEKALTALQAKQAALPHSDQTQQLQLAAALERMRLSQDNPMSINRQQTSPAGSVDWLMAGGVLIEGVGVGSDLIGIGIGALAALFD